MDQVSMAKSELRLQHWTKLIAECQSSNMSIKAWCELNNIKEKTYYYWLRKIREQALNNSPVPVSNASPAVKEKPVSFKKIEVQAPVSGMQAAVIIRLTSATVEVAQGTDQKTVEAVLLALKAVC